MRLFDQQLEHWYSLGQMTNCKMGIMSLRECNSIHERASMAEATDVYADQFQLNLGPLGCALNFLVSGANPVAPGSMPPIERVA